VETAPHVVVNPAQRHLFQGDQRLECGLLPQVLRHLALVGAAVGVFQQEFDAGVRRKLWPVSVPPILPVESVVQRLYRRIG